MTPIKVEKVGTVSEMFAWVKDDGGILGIHMPPLGEIPATTSKHSIAIMFKNIIIKSLRELPEGSVIKLMHFSKHGIEVIDEIRQTVSECAH